jgi:purine nucleoside permease
MVFNRSISSMRHSATGLPQLTKNTRLPDDSTLQQVRSGYPTYPNALKPPFVLEGDDLAADTFWIGDLLNT